MKTLTLQYPELGLIIGTRAMAGAGVALLLADKLDEKQQKAIGWTLLATGIITTIPLALLVLSKSCGKASDPEGPAPP